MDKAQVWYHGWIVVRMGGPTSGNYGHRGRPGLRGGSLPRGGHRALFKGMDPDEQKRLVGLYKSYRKRLGDAQRISQDVPDYVGRSAELWAQDNGIARRADYQRLGIQSYTINKTMAELLHLTGEKGLGTIHDRPDGQWNCEAYDGNEIGIGSNISIGGGKKPGAAWQHTMYLFDNPAEAATRHEFGHIFHDRHRVVFADLLSESIKGQWNWKVDYAMTSRSQDNWGECIAENFVLFSIGEIRDMAPKMLATFLELTHDRG